MPGLVTTLQWYIRQAYINLNVYVTRTKYWSPDTQPDLLKTYGRRELYATRIFFPKGHDAEGTYPLLIMIHGGGFALYNPASDDPLARRLSDSANCIVASVDYRKTPSHPFPAAYEDIVERCVSLMHDTRLRPHIDPSRVAMLGSSAGGNLALAAAQDGALKGKITGIVGIYPVAEMTTPFKEKMARTNHGEARDLLEDGYDDMCDFYVPASCDRTDPRISPAHFKSRCDLPQRVYLIGAEQDLLCTENRLLAERLAEGEQKVQTPNGWTAGGVKWDLIKGQIHAFEYIPKQDPAAERERAAVTEQLLVDIATWLRSCLG